MRPAFSDTMTINRPITEVFEFISDLRNGPKMNEDIINVEKLSEGPIAVGSKFIETRVIRGMNAEAKIEVVQYEPSKAFSAQSNANGLIVTYHYNLSEGNPGTIVKFQCEVQTSGIIMAITKPFIVKMLKKEDAEHLKNIKRAIESGEN